MADLERELVNPGDGGQAPESTERWVHRHGASGERVEKYPGDPDPELSFTGIIWTGAGIAGITVVAMVLMVWLMGGLDDYLAALDEPTPAELERREAVRSAGEDRILAEPVPGPGLVVPPDLELPPEPRLEVTKGWNLEQLRLVEDRLLGEWADLDGPAAGSVRIPIDVAIDLAAAGELPGVPRGGAAPAGAAEGEAGEALSGAGDALREAGESGLGTGARVHEPEAEPPATGDPIAEPPLEPGAEENHGRD